MKNSKKEEIVNLVKQLFSVEEEKVDVKTELKTLTDVDGVVLDIDEEGNVTIAGEVAPDRDYVISDEETITVVDGKMVVSEEEVVVEEDLEDKEKMSTDEVVDATEDVVTDEVVTDESESESRMGVLEDAVEKLLGKISELEGQLKGTEAKFAAFKKSPADKEIKFKRSDFMKSNSDKLSNAEKYAKILKNVKK